MHTVHDTYRMWRPGYGSNNEKNWVVLPSQFLQLKVKGCITYNMFTTPGGYQFSGIHLFLDTFNAEVYTVLGCVQQILPIVSGMELKDVPPESKIQGVSCFWISQLGRWELISEFKIVRWVGLCLSRSSWAVPLMIEDARYILFSNIYQHQWRLTLIELALMFGKFARASWGSSRFYGRFDGLLTYPHPYGFTL